MVWIWDFFSSVAFFTLLSSFLPSSWKKTLRDLRSQFSWFILQPFSRIKKEGGGRGNFSFRSSWCPVHFLLCFLVRARVWVAGSVPAQGAKAPDRCFSLTLMFLSLSFSLPSLLSKNKQIKSLKRKWVLSSLALLTTTKRQKWVFNKGGKKVSTNPKESIAPTRCLTIRMKFRIIIESRASFYSRWENALSSGIKDLQRVGWST